MCMIFHNVLSSYNYAENSRYSIFVCNKGIKYYHPSSFWKKNIVQFIILSYISEKIITLV